VSRCGCRRGRQPPRKNERANRKEEKKRKSGGGVAVGVPYRIRSAPIPSVHPLYIYRLYEHDENLLKLTTKIFTDGDVRMEDPLRDHFLLGGIGVDTPKGAFVEKYA
jgi:hypothetical protein